MRQSFMAWLKSVTEMCLKTYLSTFPHMRKITGILLPVRKCWKVLKTNALLSKNVKTFKRLAVNHFLNKTLFCLKLSISPVTIKDHSTPLALKRKRRNRGCSNFVMNMTLISSSKVKKPLMKYIVFHFTR